MVKRVCKRRASNFPEKRINPKRPRWTKKKINELPLEVLASIFELIPRDELASVSLQCKAFRNAIGLIARRDLCKYKRELDCTIHNLICLIANGAYDPTRWDICQKIGYLRFMKLKLSTVEAILGNYTLHEDLWNMLSIHMLEVIREQHSLLRSVIGFPYFIKDIRPRYVNSNMRSTERLLNRFFAEIDPIVCASENVEPLPVQFFNLLNTCQSANTRIVAFHSSIADVSLISMFFEIRGLGRMFEFERFNEYKDEATPMYIKLTELKSYFHNVLEHENSEFLFYQMEQILSLENRLDLSNGSKTTEEVLNNLERAYNTFLYNTYQELNHMKTKFYFNDIEVYKQEISRQQEIRSCVSNVVLNLKFCCPRKDLPSIVAFNREEADLYVYENNESVMSTITECLKLQEVLAGNNTDMPLRLDKNAMHINLLISHNVSQKSLTVLLREFEFYITKREAIFNVIKDEIMSRFSDLHCECHENGTACNNTIY